MSLSATNINDLGMRLYEAWKNASQIPPITESFSNASIEDAYQIQLAMMNQRIKSGETVVGKKIGITAKIVMDMLGVDQPDFGHLTSGMEFKNSDDLPTKKFCQPKGEGEIAFLLNKDLIGPGITYAQVIAATECVVPAFEIVDSRIKDWKIKIFYRLSYNTNGFSNMVYATIRSISNAVNIFFKFF